MQAATIFRINPVVVIKLGVIPIFNHSMYDRVDDLVDRLLQPISKNFEFHILLFCFILSSLSENGP